MWFVNIFSHSVGCFFIIFFKKICFIYVFLAALGLRCCMGFSLVEPTGAALQLWWRLLLWSMGFRACGLWWLQLPCSKTRVQEWWCTGLAASQHWGIFPEQGLNPCFLNWQVDSTTEPREALLFRFVDCFFFSVQELFSVKVKVLVTPLCPAVCDPMDCSRPGPSVQGILRARILEGVAISISRGSSWSKTQTWVSCIMSRFFTIWAKLRNPLVWCSSTGLFLFPLLVLWCHIHKNTIKSLPGPMSMSFFPDFF